MSNGTLLSWMSGPHLTSRPAWSTVCSRTVKARKRETLLSEKERKIKCPTTLPLHCLEESVPNTAVSVSIFVTVGGIYLSRL